MQERPRSPKPASATADADRGDSPASETPLVALLRRNLASVRHRLDAAAAQTGRPSPTLVAVTKTVPNEVALALHALSQEHLAENRADPFVQKVAAFDAAGQRPVWHFVGHLQRNKARRVLEHVDVLHSVDSRRLAETVIRITDELRRDVDVFLQVNFTGETEKHGLRSDEAGDVATLLGQAGHVHLRGLMAMGPLAEREGARTVDEVFGEAAARARELQRAVPGAFVEERCELSMGMSGDAEAAIARGSDLVRVGSALFEGVERIDREGASRAS
ncbi:MAG: YggS family pyridoxal phosphate-dependent enzyme [Planctomycetota bacterium]